MKMKLRINILIIALFGLFISSFNSAFAQETIELKQAGALEGGTFNGMVIRKLKKNCIFKHGSSTLYCDSAYQYQDKNELEAFGHVKIVQADGSVIQSSNLTYNTDNKMVNFRGGVTLTDKTFKLTTPTLDYNLADKTATYNEGGVIVDKGTTLTSKRGHYNSNTKIFTFKENVKLISKEHTLEGDTLMYNTENKTTYFNGPTKIKSKKETLISSKGEYNTQTGIMVLKGRSQIETPEMILSGDTLNFNKKTQDGDARGNVEIVLRKEKVTIKGKRCIHIGKKHYTKVYGNAFMVALLDKDTLFLKGDTLISINDSIKKKKSLTAFHHVRVFRHDLQAICDSMIYNMRDSSINFYKDPVLWANKSQLTGDTVKVQMAKNKIDKFYLRTNSFVISTDSIRNFNQIKGKRIVGSFTNNKLQNVKVNGNGESIYFATENDTILIGLNKVLCSNMNIKFVDNKLKDISFLTKPDAKFIPPHEIDEPTRRLKGFRWRITEKPERKQF